MVLEDRAQLDCAGAPLQVRLTDPVKPPSGFNCKLYVAGCPAVIVTDVEPPPAALNEKSVPVPDNETVWGLTVAASLTVRVPIRFPAAVGLNVTLIAQLPPEAMLVPQLSVSVKSDAFVPPICTAEMLKAELPILLSVAT